MGSERKSKDDERKKKRIYRSSSEDEGKSKRRRTADDKKKKKKKHKSDKPSKHHSDKGELKSDTKHKDKRHKHDRHSKVEFQEISSEDYFLKNNEFSTWLKEEKSTFFSDLSSESARKQFSKFVDKWNHGKLESRYYEGISTAPRTSHNWKVRQ